MAVSVGMQGFFGLGVQPKRELRSRLNLVAAAEAHILWKTRLGHHVHGNIREPLESAPVGQDGICQLGIWINGPVFEPLRGSDAYQRIYDAHRQFHQMGDLIIEKLRTSDRGGAEKIFANEYTQSLHHLIQSLVEINKILQAD